MKYVVVLLVGLVVLWVGSWASIWVLSLWLVETILRAFPEGIVRLFLGLGLLVLIMVTCFSMAKICEILGID